MVLSYGGDDLEREWQMFIEKAKSFAITLFLLGLIAARHVIALCFLPSLSFPS